jgi:membrane-associated phospholipid phosphatase
MAGGGVQALRVSVAFLVLPFFLLLASEPAKAQEQSSDEAAEDVAHTALLGSWIEWPSVDASTTANAWAGPLLLAFEEQAEKPPQPMHTGFKALAIETGKDFYAFPQRKSTWVVLALGGAGAAIAYPYDDQVNAKLTGSDAAANFFAAGKYIGSGYVQAGTAVGLYVIGRFLLPHVEGEPRTNKVSHLGFDLIRTLILSETVTHGIKLTVRRDRPTGECCSFPSGHASAAFATASVLERHLGYRGAWPTYVVASYVAASRLHDNRHFLSDVIFGSAIGISSGWTVVGRHGRSSYALVPVPVSGGMMVSLTKRLPPE